MKCDSGPPFQITGNDSPRVTITNYSEPALNGTVAFLECPLGLVLSRQDNKTVCNAQGEWEPDPSEVNCYTSQDIMGDFCHCFYCTY